MVPILSRLFLHRGAVDTGTSLWPQAQEQSFRSAEQQPSKATALSNTMALAVCEWEVSPTAHTCECCFEISQTL